MQYWTILEILSCKIINYISHDLFQVGPQLSLIQGEVAQTVLEMTKAQKTYNIDEGQAHEARIKHKEAEDK